MTFRDDTAPGQTSALHFVFDLAHPPQKVWRALTEPDLLAEWLLPTLQWKLAVGHAFQLQGPVMPQWDGKVHGSILEVEPEKKLSYSWVVGLMNTVVTFTLTPTATGTQLQLDHAGFRDDQKQNWGGARYGWRQMGQKLEDLLAR